MLQSSVSHRRHNINLQNIPHDSYIHEGEPGYQTSIGCLYLKGATPLPLAAAHWPPVQSRPVGENIG